MKPKIKFAKRLEIALEAHGWSQRTLAAYSGVSNSYISLLMSGANTNPGLEVLVAFADTLDVSLDWLAGRPKQDPETLDPEEEELLRIYRNLPDDLREQLFGIAMLYRDRTE